MPAASCDAGPEEGARRPGQSLGTAMAHSALTLERTNADTSVAATRPRPNREGDPAGDAADCRGTRHSRRDYAYLTARRAEDGELFRVFLTPEDLRRLVGRAMERDETAAIVREAANRQPP